MGNKKISAAGDQQQAALANQPSGSSEEDERRWWQVHEVEVAQNVDDGLDNDEEEGIRGCVGGAQGEPYEVHEVADQEGHGHGLEQLGRSAHGQLGYPTFKTLDSIYIPDTERWASRTKCTKDIFLT